MYQKHVKQKEGTIRHLKNKLKEGKEEICKLKAGKVSSNFMEKDNSGNWRGNKQKISIPDPVGSLQMMLVKFN
jgi:hypothetical protein